MDPIGDMLTAIRNALAVRKTTVTLPFSNLKFEAATLLEKESLIEKVEKKGRGSKKSMEITLKYDGGNPAIYGLKRVSKPSQRIYLPFKKIKKVKGGFGISIISTSKGLMTNKEARKKKIGGEILCEVW